MARTSYAGIRSVYAGFRLLGAGSDRILTGQRCPTEKFFATPVSFADTRVAAAYSVVKRHLIAVKRMRAQLWRQFVRIWEYRGGGSKRARRWNTGHSIHACRRHIVLWSTLHTGCFRWQAFEAIALAARFAKTFPPLIWGTEGGRPIHEAGRPSLHPTHLRARLAPQKRRRQCRGRRRQRIQL